MASVIKAAGVARTGDTGAFNFDDLSVKGQAYLDQVRAQAAQLLAKAQQDAVAIRARAEQEGKQAALAAANAQLDEKVGKHMTTLLPALQQAIDSITQARHAWLAHSEKSTVHLAAAIAARVVRRELVQQPDITVALVKEALEMAAGCGEVVLRLNPGDHAALAGQIKALTTELSRLGKAEVVADPAISLGGCRVDTRMGTIDQQFEAQLARIEQELN